MLEDKKRDSSVMLGVRFHDNDEHSSDVIYVKDKVSNTQICRYIDLFYYNLFSSKCLRLQTEQFCNVGGQVS